MITVKNIDNAKDQSEISDLIKLAAYERGIDLRCDFTYGEDAERLESEIGDDNEMSKLLYAAEARWFAVGN